MTEAPLTSPQHEGSPLHPGRTWPAPPLGEEGWEQSPRDGRTPDTLASAPVVREAGRQHGAESGGPIPTAPATALACPAPWSRRLTDDLTSLGPWSEAPPGRPGQNLHAPVGPAIGPDTRRPGTGFLRAAEARWAWGCSHLGVSIM